MLGKTEGNGCVNDFSRGFATPRTRRCWPPARRTVCAEVEARAQFIMSGGHRGIYAP